MENNLLHHSRGWELTVEITEERRLRVFENMILVPKRDENGE